MTEKELTESQMWEALSKTSGLARASLLIELSRQAQYRGSHTESLELAQAGVDEYESVFVSCDENLAEAYLTLATAHRNLKNYNGAISVVDKAIKIARDANYPFLDDILRSKATWCEERGSWNSALETHLEAVQFNELTGSQIWMGKSLFNVGQCLFKMGRFIDAIDSLKRTRLIFVKEKKISLVGQIDRLLADCFLELQIGDEALRFAMKSLDVADVLGERTLIMKANFTLAKTYLLLEEVNKAEQSLDKVDDLMVSCHLDDIDWAFIITVYEVRINLLNKSNKVAEALALKSRIRTIHDILHAAT